tara:strand:+ start:72 stop:908 length:837 start_codon:yes stop_codon:yes gene_type:complete
MILENVIKKGSKALRDEKIISHQLDAQILLSNIMGVTKEFIMINDDRKISNEIINKYNIAIRRRLKNEPIAYITGKKEFWSETFEVNHSTLIPRPETELLVYEVIKLFKNKSINVLDIGSGSGCILLSILKELTNSVGIGIDISKKAVQTSIFNAKKMNLSKRASFKICDISKFFLGKYDLIVSNPPYISSKDIKKLSKDIINYEPLSALNGGIDGLDLTKKVIYKSSKLLKKSGIFALEIGNRQYFKVSHILKKNGFGELGKVYDYNDNVRCIISTK